MKEECRVCKIIPILLGKKIFLPLFGRTYPRLLYRDVLLCMEGLQLNVVGGLRTKGWTVHDIDVVGNLADVPLLEKRLRTQNILNPIHFCYGHPNHSHFRCAWNGIKLVLTGRGY